MNENCFMENQKIKVALNKETLAVSIKDKASGALWNSKGLLQLTYGQYVFNLAEHCSFKIKQAQNKIRISFKDMDFRARFRGHGYKKPENGPDLRFEASIILNNDNVAFRLDEIGNMDEEECIISFPFGIIELDSGKESQLVFPSGYGLIYEFPRNDYFSFEEDYGFFGFNMPVCGIFNKTGGLGAYIKTPFDCNAKININSVQKGLADIKLSFTFEKEMANYPREIAFYPLGKKANYVTLAKLYRQILKEDGHFVSLDEKIRQNPDVEKLVGSVIWKHNTFSKTPPAGLKKNYSLYMMNPDHNICEGLPANWTAKEFFETAHKRGFDRVCVYNTGWNYGGYDSHFPKRFPPNEERGTEKDFKWDADYARSLSDGFIYSVHDNYRDIYKNSPEFKEDYLIKNKNGIPSEGGIWRGGRAFSMCPYESLKYAKRDIPRLRKMLGSGSIYIDVMGCVKLENCYDRKHPASRREDAQKRKELLGYIKSQMGSVATESAPADYLNDTVDLGSFCYIHALSANPTTNPLPVPIPFYQLVYHDSVLNYTTEDVYRFYGSEYLLYVALYGLLPFSIEPVSLKLSKELRNAYKSEMVSHEFIEGNPVTRDEKGFFWSRGVQKTVFSDGTEVIANFNKKTYTYKGVKIKARDFIIRKKK